MPRRNVLVSWIGHADLLAMGEDLGDAGRELLSEVKVQGRPVDRPGPIKTALSCGTFEAVHLLSNYPDAVHRPFLNWLGRHAELHRVELHNPTDYSGVFRAADETLARVAAAQKADDQLCILLSPGTPAMTAVWVLLGKSRYPATFYQTHRAAMTEATIPYDLIDDFVPANREVRKRLDHEHLARSSPAGATIKLADLIDNSSSIVKHDKGFARSYLREKELLLDVLRHGEPALWQRAFETLQAAQSELVQDRLGGGA